MNGENYLKLDEVGCRDGVERTASEKLSSDRNNRNRTRKSAKKGEQINWKRNYAVCGCAVVVIILPPIRDSVTPDRAPRLSGCSSCPTFYFSRAVNANDGRSAAAECLGARMRAHSLPSNNFISIADLVSVAMRSLLCPCSVPRFEFFAFRGRCSFDIIFIAFPFLFAAFSSPALSLAPAAHSHRDAADATSSSADLYLLHLDAILLVIISIVIYRCQFWLSPRSASRCRAP